MCKDSQKLILGNIAQQQELVPLYLHVFLNFKHKANNL